jgi:hypothetical protein
LPVATAALESDTLVDEVGAERAGHLLNAVTRVEAISELDTADAEADVAAEVADHLAASLPRGSGRLRSVGRAVGWVAFRGSVGVAGGAAGAKLATEVSQLPNWGLSPGWMAVVGGVLAILATFAPRSLK